MTESAIPAPPRPVRHRRIRGALHLVFGLVVAGVVLWAVGGQRGELQGALSYLEDLKWQWVAMAGVVEFLALVASVKVVDSLDEAPCSESSSARAAYEPP